MKAKDGKQTHLRAFPIGKNVTFENRCPCCFLGLSLSYLLCKITVETCAAEQAIPYPPMWRWAQIESEIIPDLHSECHNQNVTGLGNG